MAKSVEGGDSFEDDFDIDAPTANSGNEVVEFSEVPENAQLDGALSPAEDPPIDESKKKKKKKGLFRKREKKKSETPKATTEVESKPAAAPRPKNQFRKNGTAVLLMCLPLVCLAAAPYVWSPKQELQDRIFTAGFLIFAYVLTGAGFLGRQTELINVKDAKRFSTKIECSMMLGGFFAFAALVIFSVIADGQSMITSIVFLVFALILGWVSGTGAIWLWSLEATPPAAVKEDTSTESENPQLEFEVAEEAVVTTT